MTDALKLAEDQLLAPGGLDQRSLERVLADLMGPAVDAGDLYFQSTTHESWVLENGLVRSGSHAVEQGVGIRAMAGEKTGFAYADEIVMPSLLQASRNLFRSTRSIPMPGSGLPDLPVEFIVLKDGYEFGYGVDFPVGVRLRPSVYVAVAGVNRANSHRLGAGDVAFGPVADHERLFRADT